MPYFITPSKPSCCQVLDGAFAITQDHSVFLVIRGVFELSLINASFELKELYKNVTNDLLNIVREGGGKGGGGGWCHRITISVHRLPLSKLCDVNVARADKQQMEAFSPPIALYRVPDLSLSGSAAGVDFVSIQSSVLLIC